MSKKNKNKFRKRIQAEIAQQLSQAGPAKPIAKQPVIVDNKVQPISEPPKAPTITENDNQFFIKKDLKKSGLIIGSIIITIIALYLLDNHYGFLLKGGSQVFKLLHIQV